MPIMDKSGNKRAINIKVMFPSECFSVSVIYNRLCVCQLCYVLRSHMWSLRQKTECISFTKWAINPALFHVPVSFNFRMVSYYHISNTFFITQKYIGRTPGENKNIQQVTHRTGYVELGLKVYSSAFPGLPTLTYHINSILCYL